MPGIREQNHYHHAQNIANEVTKNVFPAINFGMFQKIIFILYSTYEHY